MQLDLIRCTHNGTGGTGALTLAAISGWPQPTDALGTSGTIMADYEITEYTDSTKVTLLQSERGRAALNLATNSLSRAPLVTWASGTYNAKNPTAITFGNTAANIDILMGVSAVNLRPALPAVQTNAGNNEAYMPANTRVMLDSNAAGVALVAGQRYYIPCEVAYGKPISVVGVSATSVATTGNVRIAVYEWGSDGNPGALITEFTSSSQIAISTATGIKTLTLATPFWLPPGWYFFMLQADAAVQLNFGNPAGHSGIGSNNSRDGMYLYKSGTYGAAPSTADTALSFQSRSASPQPVVYIR